MVSLDREIRLRRPIAKYFGYRPPQHDAVVVRRGASKRVRESSRLHFRPHARLHAHCADPMMPEEAVVTRPGWQLATSTGEARTRLSSLGLGRTRLSNLGLGG